MLYPDYHISRAVVLSNEQKVYDDNGITYMPVYYVMFFKNQAVADGDCIIPEYVYLRLDNHEIADAMGITEETVRVHKLRAIKSLRKRLGANEILLRITSIL